MDRSTDPTPPSATTNSTSALPSPQTTTSQLTMSTRVNSPMDTAPTTILTIPDTRGNQNPTAEHPPLGSGPPLPVPLPRGNSTEALLLRDVFRTQYGKDWREAYEFPDVREHVLEELRTQLCKEIRTAYLNPDLACTSTQSRSLANCPCYLHKYFGADEDIRFPNCPQEGETQPRQQFRGTRSPQQ